MSATAEQQVIKRSFTRGFNDTTRDEYLNHPPMYFGKYALAGNGGEIENDILDPMVFGEYALGGRQGEIAYWLHTPWDSPAVDAYNDNIFDVWHLNDFVSMEYRYGVKNNTPSYCETGWSNSGGVVNNCVSSSDGGSPLYAGQAWEPDLSSFRLLMNSHDWTFAVWHKRKEELPTAYAGKILQAPCSHPDFQLFAWDVNYRFTMDGTDMGIVDFGDFGEWMLVVLSCNSTTQEITLRSVGSAGMHKDGGSWAAISGWYIKNTENAKILGPNGSPSYIDEIMMWDTEISDEAVNAIYAAGIAGRGYNEDYQ